MNGFSFIFKNEVSLLSRNKFLILPLVINVLCWGTIITFYEVEPFHFETRGELFYTNFQWILVVNLLLLGLFATYVGGKDSESEFESLVITYSVKNTHWLIGKWFVAQCYGACFTLITLFIQELWFLSGGMEVDEVVQNSFYIFFQMEGALFLIISIGFLLGSLIRSVISYMITPVVIGWMTYITVTITINSPINPRLKLILSQDAMYTVNPYSGIWGIGNILGNSLLHQAVVLLAGFFLLVVTLLIYRPRRSQRKEKFIVITMLVAVSIPAMLLGKQRYNQYDVAFKHYLETGQTYLMPLEEEESFYENRWDQTKSNFSMEQTDLVVVFPLKDTISVKSELVIRHNGEIAVNELELTLHHALSVTNFDNEIIDSFIQDGDSILVKTKEMIQPQQLIQLKLNYEGNIKQYRNDALVEQSFSSEDGIYLPKEAGWYPLIGKRKLAISSPHSHIYSNFDLRNGRMVETIPTAFTVHIDQPYGIPITLTIPEVEKGIYKGISYYGLSLIGGNFKEEVFEGIRLIGHSDLIPGARNEVTMSIDGWRSIEEWLGVPVVPEVIYIMDFMHAELTRQSPSREFLVWDGFVLKGLLERETTRAFYTTSSLVGDYLFNTNNDLRNDSRIVISLMDWEFQKHFGTASNFESYSEVYYESNLAISPREEKLIHMIGKYEQKGEVEFSALVKSVYLQYEEMEDKTGFNLVNAIEVFEQLEIEGQDL
ncbi:hypothetical protein [Sporosarcina limicola]|uniref:Uncharacterized protein n=1 Tax=Sporosarcina limicola TaxID=34101 RepID=A0A927RG24_9BACL|nr:hypothetical protein [Sporosarcina limicola]MBE1556112.1 hypothetical protein [Sporosarcina limicola]